MKTLFFLAIGALILFVLRSCGLFGQTQHTKLSLEVKLQQLSSAEINLMPGIGTELLLSKFEREEYEKPGFDLLLSMMGGDDEGETYQQVCDSLYWFDSECIGGNGSYAVHIKRIAAITGGILDISSITDTVDFDNQKAWAKFECNGKQVHIDIELDDDWFDTRVLECLIALFNDKKSEMNLYFVGNEDGQSILIGCLSKPSEVKLTQLGIKVAELNFPFPKEGCIVKDI